MALNDIITLIGSVGFPIVCCLIMFFMQHKQDERHSADLRELRSSLEDNNKLLVSLVEDNNDFKNCVLLFLKGVKKSNEVQDRVDD